MTLALSGPTTFDHLEQTREIPIYAPDRARVDESEDEEILSPSTIAVPEVGFPRLRELGSAQLTKAAGPLKFGFKHQE